MGPGRNSVGRVFTRTRVSGRGRPGTGKTTIALQFLMEGARAGEKCLYITLSETERELARRRRLAWLVAGRADRGVRIAAAGKPARFRAAAEPALFVGSRTGRDDQADIRSRRTRAGRAAWCSTACRKSGCWRRARCAIAGRSWRSNTISHNIGATVLMLDDLTAEAADKTVHSVAHGVMRLEELAPAYGAERRRVRVIKYRGVEISRRLSRLHDHHRRRLNVFPRLVAAEHRTPFDANHDVERHRRVRHAAGRRHRGRIQHADPRPRRHRQIPGRPSHSSSRRSRAAKRRRCSCSTRNSGCCSTRMKGLGIDLEAMRKRGKLFIEQVDAAELSPGEFAHRVCRRVDQDEDQDRRDRQPQWLPSRDA